MGATLSTQAAIKVVKALPANTSIAASATIASILGLTDAELLTVRGVKIVPAGGSAYLNEKGLETGTPVTATASTSGYTDTTPDGVRDTLPYGGLDLKLVTIIGTTASFVAYREA